MQTEPVAQTFISYVHSEDDVLHFAEPLKKAIEMRYMAVVGGPLEVFLDKTGISLGDDWRKSLTEAARRSSAFIACTSGAYMNSQACRDEFTEFLGAAESLGVSKLLIPVLTNGAAFISNFPDDEIAQYIEQYQFLDFGDGLRRGAASDEFLQGAFALADRIAEVVKDAETVAVTREFELVEASQVPHSADDGNESVGILDGQEAFVSSIESANQHVESVGIAIGQIGGVFENYDFTGNFKSADAVLLSRKVDPLSMQIEMGALEALAELRRADAALRGVIAAATYGGMREEAEQALREGFSDVDSVNETVNQLDSLLAAMRVPEAMSSALRKSLLPMRKGVVAMRDAASLFDGWRALLDGLD